MVNQNNDKQKYFLQTFGCQMNERDSETMAGLLEGMGYEPVANAEDADIIILNTCTVRETAENKVWGRIGELKALKSKKPDVIIGICGCMAQQKETAEKIRRKAPHIELIFGTHNIHELPEMINRLVAERKPLLNVWNAEGSIVENLPARRKSKVKAFVSIMFGCNNFCTYCIVPYVRGRERSRQIADIVREVKSLAEQGYKEVTLLGQNVNSYGKDLPEKTDFSDLLEVLNEIDGIRRIRYMTSHPRDFTSKLIDVIARSEKVCEHFHLPVQSGSNSILKKMNRGYTREYYFELVAEIRSKIPHASITTDIIVGFPGETRQDFENTMDLLDKVRYDSAFTFVYNKRSGTPAASMTDQVPDEEKSKRIVELIEFQNKISLEKNLCEVGREHEVLAEGLKNSQNKVEARTRTNKLVLLNGDSNMIGNMYRVKIVKAGPWHLDGEILSSGKN
ncbi:tRNA (N6-isopentenyl adenosine(37)-C2)-methylthiotransferase MiaB [Thermincola potens]|uniref:tRNA-2-methylthio-N(6)-dimethylallyladenosine synthase n=1 Tax=Thermincola potens (strain JR) TaxID=635013 RepID=D5XFB9_THEPJ|nr:tRNA (N6-isopentenyl adenosine(37)-C2)-methylthiotransferase MiaB [Thermincola potens]ADG82340.1 RNA modification enzyme, MiaB family [Thermincola potens JR]